MKNNMHLISNHLPAEKITCEYMSLPFINALYITHLCIIYVCSHSLVLLITNKKSSARLCLHDKINVQGDKE